MSYPHPPVPENPPVKRRQNIENKRSLLLSNEENQCIFDILGKGRQTLATAVAQILVPSPLDQQRWQIKDTGVLCLVRDTTKRSYFIQVFSLRTKSMVFRQEIYTQFEYTMPLPWFLTFEGDSQRIGINFADRVEAANYKEALDIKLESRRQRKARNSRNFEQTSATQNLRNNNTSMVHSNITHKYPNGTSASAVTSYQNQIPAKKETKKGKKDKKKSLRKEDIGTPMDFRHVQHVGWNPNRGFDLNGVDQDFQKFFEMAGISHNQLEDENTRQFIYSFIEKHGGVEAVKRSVQSPASPPPVPPPPSMSSGSEAPPVPARHPSYPSLPSIKPAAPPPPPSRPIPPPPPSSGQFESPVKFQGNVGSTAPPPPPPMPRADMEPSRRAMNENADEPSITRSHERVQQAPPPPPVEDERSALMKQIQAGISLKKVDPVKKQNGSSSSSCASGEMDGLAKALARALELRHTAINPDTSSSDEDGDEGSDSDDEWK